MGVRSQTGGGHSESGSSARGGFACFFFQDRLAASYLGDDRVEFLAVFGDAAVGDVVAIPAGRRIEGIELGQVELGDSSGEAVDQQPATALPLPARGVGAGIGISVGGLGGQRIVHAKSAPDHKQAVGQFMRSSGGVFLEPRIHKQRTHFQVEQLLSGGVGPLGGDPFSKSDDMRFRDGRAFAPGQAHQDANQ